MRPSFKYLCLAGALFTLGACSTVSDMFSGRSDEKKPLEGERISVLELQEAIEPADASLEASGLITPEPWKNEFWPQMGGYPNHSMQNLLLNEGELKQVWSANIGTGSSRAAPLTAHPVLVDGRLFTLDTKGQMRAFDINNGKQLWEADVSDPSESDDDSVITGGVAYSGGFLYVTNGSDEILSVQPASGKILWRKPLPAPSRAAPTILDGRLFVTTVDSRLLALSALDGSVLWEYTGVSEMAGLVGAASAAANRDIVVPVFPSGDVVALRVENGSAAWSDNLASVKRFGGLSTLSDIIALPVIDRGLVIAVSFGGRMVAIDERSGTRVWQREIGGTNTPWMAGNHAFVLNSENQLVSMGRDNGVIRWVTKLEGETDKKKKKKPIFAGPILAGGRLFVANSESMIIEVNPEDGQIIRQWEAHGPITIPPIVAGGVMYILSDNGTISAYK